MSTSSQATARGALREARRIVVKIGSRSLTASPTRFAELAQQVAGLHEAGRSVVLVSSGAIALGFARLGLERRPDSMALLQASAAAGQSRLMRAYEEAFAVHNINVAQVLLTRSVMTSRERYLNARAALSALIERRVVPIINENDSVSVDEITFGDNDQLAAMVATLVSAELLVLLTHVDGLLGENGKRISIVPKAEQVSAWVRPEVSSIGLGGMASKLMAASNAAQHGVPVVIANADDPAILDKILSAKSVGTLFLPQGVRLASRKHWIAFTLKSCGVILVDAGAERALVKGKSSLLPAGVVGVRGDFRPGDAIAIYSASGNEFARGLTRYGMIDVARLAGARSQEIASRVGHTSGEEIVHRDDLVILP